MLLKLKEILTKLNYFSPKLKRVLLKLKVTGKSVCSYLQNCSEKISLAYDVIYGCPITSLPHPHFYALKPCRNNDVRPTYDVTTALK